jgi:hypothetical protein
MRLWNGKEVWQMLVHLLLLAKRWDPRRKECCYPFVAGDLFKYMSALIKVSNHLALILPSEPL